MIKTTSQPKRLILAGLLTLLFYGFPAAAQTDVYLFGGQSNMVPGIVKGFRAEMEAEDPSRVMVTPRYRNPGVGLNSGWGGTTWHGDPPGSGRKNFYPGTDASDPNMGSAYTAMLAAWQKALARIEGPYEIKGIFWVQGEQDAKEQISAERYASSLKNLISRIHIDLGLEPASVPFYYSTMESPSGRFKHRATVKAQQHAADKNSGDPLAIPVVVFMGGGYATPIERSVEAFEDLFASAAEVHEIRLNRGGKG